MVFAGQYYLFLFMLLFILFTILLFISLYLLPLLFFHFFTHTFHISDAFFPIIWCVHILFSIFIHPSISVSFFCITNCSGHDSQIFTVSYLTHLLSCWFELIVFLLSTTKLKCSVSSVYPSPSSINASSTGISHMAATDQTCLQLERTLVHSEPQYGALICLEYESAFPITWISEHFRVRHHYPIGIYRPIVKSFKQDMLAEDWKNLQYPSD